MFSSHINIVEGEGSRSWPTLRRVPHFPAPINHPEYRQHLSSSDVSDRSASPIKLGGKGKIDPREHNSVRSFYGREKNAGLCVGRALMDS